MTAAEAKARYDALQVEIDRLRYERDRFFTTAKYNRIDPINRLMAQIERNIEAEADEQYRKPLHKLLMEQSDAFRDYRAALNDIKQPDIKRVA